MSGATLYVEALWASELAAACAEDLVAGMAASGGLPAVDWDTAYAEADDWHRSARRSRQKARMVSLETKILGHKPPCCALAIRCSLPVLVLYLREQRTTAS